MKFKLLICFLFFLFNSISQSTYTVYKSDKSVFYADQKQGNYSQLKKGKSLSTKVYVKSSKGKVVLIENSTKKVYEIEIVGVKKLGDALKNKKTDNSFESNLMQTIVSSFVSTNEDPAISRNGISERGSKWIVFKDLPQKSYVFNSDKLAFNFQKSKDSIEIKIRQFNQVLSTSKIIDSNLSIQINDYTFDKFETFVVEATRGMNKEKIDIRFLDSEISDKLAMELSGLTDLNDTDIRIQKAIILENYGCIFESIEIIMSIPENDINQEFKLAFIEKLVNKTVVFN